MKLIRMDDNVYEVFSRWLRSEPYPSEHNYPRIIEAWDSILSSVKNVSTIDYEDMLREFHLKYGHYIHYNRDADIPPEVKLLRLKLMHEELGEVLAAILTDNYVEIADGLADLIYVTVGTAISYGIPINKVFAEVQRSNMTKSMEKDTKSVKGKTLKGPDWSPPDIPKILFGSK